MKSLAFAASLLLASACASNQVTVETPTTPPDTGFVSNPASPTAAPTSANTVDPVPGRLPPSDTTSRPQWLQERIANVLKERKRTPIIRILSYNYRGQQVYYQSAPCCDQYSTVYDSRGRVVCNPDGGITGQGDGKCPDFDKNKTNEKLVWQDPR